MQRRSPARRARRRGRCRPCRPPPRPPAGSWPAPPSSGWSRAGAAAARSPRAPARALRGGGGARGRAGGRAAADRRQPLAAGRRAPARRPRRRALRRGRERPPVELRRELTPAVRLPPAALHRHGRLMRRRGGVLERLLHHGRAAGAGAGGADRPGRVADRRARAEPRGGRARHRADALRARRRRRPAAVPAALRARPADRPLACAPAVAARGRRPEPFEALAWAICEQLIEYERAAAIERRIVGRARPPLVGWDGGTARLRDLPAAARARRGGAGAAAVLRPRRRAGAGAGARRPRGGARADRPARRPTTSAAGGGCGRSRASAPGRSRCSPCTARAATTRCPPGTWSCSSWSGGCSAAAIRGPAPEEQRCATYFAPYGEWAGLAPLTQTLSGACSSDPRASASRSSEQREGGARRRGATGVLDRAPPAAAVRRSAGSPTRRA